MAAVACLPTIRSRAGYMYSEGRARLPTMYLPSLFFQRDSLSLALTDDRALKLCEGAQDLEH